MRGYLAILLHAHLPFVRHPEQERSLEETWLFEAITECYLPLLAVMEGWSRDALPVRLTLSLSPTLLAMLQDRFLQDRFLRHLEGLTDLAEKEVFRTRWEPACHPLACHYLDHFVKQREQYALYGADLVQAFGRLQETGVLEIITCAATHAVLPFLLEQPESLRAQVRLARDQHRVCFGRDPAGFWLPECAYAPGLEETLREAGFRWFVLDTHGLLHARPRPRYGYFAPLFTPGGVAAFGRDPNSARQVWSRQEGYPGDPRYRDFYRDIGFDLDLDHVRPCLPAPEARTFTGIKYHRITGPGKEKQIYSPTEALRAADEHAAHFLKARQEEMARLAAVMDRPPLLVAPYDAELFGHWWHEGPEFLDRVVRRASGEGRTIDLITPTDYLRKHPTNQVAQPGASTWGEGGHLRVWLNLKNAWLQPRLRAAQEQMTALARRFAGLGSSGSSTLAHATEGGVSRRPDLEAGARVTRPSEKMGACEDRPSADLVERALQQAGRELLLAQASDWPFILTTGTSPDYARRRFTEHLSRFAWLRDQLLGDTIDEARLREVESQDNLFPSIDWRYWA